MEVIELRDYCHFIYIYNAFFTPLQQTKSTYLKEETTQNAYEANAEALGKELGIEKSKPLAMLL